jgi:hypothetical protein
MKKITLDIDALQVTTFVPAPEPGGARGTVRGHDTLICPSTHSCGCNPTEFYCSDGYTCGIDSCVDTCANPNRTLC